MGQIYNLVTGTMGAGTQSLPYIIMMNGIIWGGFLLFALNMISYYSGMSLVRKIPVVILNSLGPFGK